MTIITWILVAIFLFPAFIFWLSMLELTIMSAWYATQETIFLWRVLWDIRKQPADAPRLNYLPKTVLMLFVGWFHKFFYGANLESVTTINSKITYIKQGWSYERIVPQNDRDETTT